MVVMVDKSVNLKSLSLHLGVTNLSFASPRRLDKYLGTIHHYNAIRLLTPQLLILVLLGYNNY
ncbi:hypothetical protein [Photobacterium aquimaris]|uniref:hypothetical protein n=1 Tax=Photobacterium aquimaris TaxID=512643 RepID=UPI0035205DE7